ncbi:MAG: hypothetical protein FWE18_05625 [Alphaproteobacteria bacterium]|nr:hypothetical protein [Alphaproteobacteria bacterium]
MSKPILTLTPKKDSYKTEDFNIEGQFQELLKHSQDAMWHYGDLIIRLQSLVNHLDIPIRLVFNDIINKYKFSSFLILYCLFCPCLI